MREGKRWRTWAVVSVALAAASGTVAMCLSARADGRAHLVDLSTGDERTSALLFAGEQTLVLPAALSLGSTLPRAERASLEASLSDSYTQLGAEEGHVPSPFRSGTGPALIFDPHESGARSDVAVVFLHGYGGSFALQCWLVARAADALNARTVCPSIGVEGDWWTRAGEREARNAIRYARSHGAQRVVLAGLSNGGIGASRIAPRLARSIDGLVLLSGVARDAARAAVPTLIVHGQQDHMTSMTHARWFAARQPGRVELAALPGTHFLLLERRDEVRDRIARWLRRFQ